MGRPLVVGSQPFQKARSLAVAAMLAVRLLRLRSAPLRAISNKEARMDGFLEVNSSGSRGLIGALMKSSEIASSWIRL